jgi:hypothetical protein
MNKTGSCSLSGETALNITFGLGYAYNIAKSCEKDGSSKSSPSSAAIITLNVWLLPLLGAGAIMLTVFGAAM